MQGFKIKSLVWEEIQQGRYYEARVIGILYSIRLGSDGVARWQAGHMGIWHEATTIEAAKAAAQADYEGRILSALEAAPRVSETPKSEHDSADVSTTQPAAVALTEDAITKGETASQMLDRLGMDGAKWAAAFRTTALRLGYSDMDEGWLIGWFCNAIMAGHDRAQSPDATLEPAPVTPAEAAKVLDTDAERFDQADWFWRTMDPDDSADTPSEAIDRGMVGHFCVCEIASSYTGPVRYGFTAPVLDQDSDDYEFMHFATQQEAIDAAEERCAALRAIGGDA